jgi:hypothetical protein
MGFHFRRHKFGVSGSTGRRDSQFTFGPDRMRTPVDEPEPGVRYTERTPIRQGRSKTGGLLQALIGVGLLLAIIALFVE